jgi:hypothetical protein
VLPTLGRTFRQSSGKINKNFHWFLYTYIFWRSLILIKLYQKCHLTKGTEYFFSQWPDFIATLTRLSWKELVIMTGGQINAGKFSYRPVLKGSIKMCWSLHRSRIVPPWLQKFSEFWPFPFQTNPFICEQHPPRRDLNARKVIKAWNAAKITKLRTCTVKNHLCNFEDLRLTENDVPHFWGRFFMHCWSYKLCWLF